MNTHLQWLAAGGHSFARPCSLHGGSSEAPRPAIDAGSYVAPLRQAFKRPHLRTRLLYLCSVANRGSGTALHDSGIRS